MFAFFRRTKSARKANRPKAPFFRSRLEQLEDRLAPALIQAISVADPTLGGGLGNGDSGHVAISPDGRYVAFQSNAPNLVSGDTNGKTDIFVRDTLLGVTTRASTASAGIQSNNHSYSPALAVDGSGAVYVAFGSWASNLVSGDTNGAFDIFVKNLGTGVTTRVSTDSAGNQSNATSADPDSPGTAIAVDGSGIVYVAFGSWASNMVSGDTNRSFDFFVKNLSTGGTTRVSTNSVGNQTSGAVGGAQSVALAVNGSGTVYAAFGSWATNLVSGDSNGWSDVFVKNLSTGITTRISTDSGGNQGNFSSFDPALAIDGSGTLYVAFSSFASNLVSGDTNRTKDVFVKNLSTGVLTRASTDSAGNQSIDTSGGSGSHGTSLAVDGSGNVYVAFDSGAGNLVSGDINLASDVFLKNLSTGVTIRLSTNSAGNQGSGITPALAVAGSGTLFVAFSSDARLVSDDVNFNRDVYRWSASPPTADLIAYRPVTDYFEYARHPVLDDQEESSTLGPGIRINGDDDNRNGTPDYLDTSTDSVGDNDLVRVDITGSGGSLTLTWTGNLKVWTTVTKDAPMANGAVASSGQQIWIEYVSQTHTTSVPAALTLRASNGIQSTNDQVVFHSFQSVVIAIGGRDADPANVGDPDQGAFTIADKLYEQGYDVHKYRHDEVGSSDDSAAYNEVVAAVAERNVDYVAIYGHSWGGGATYELAMGLQANTSIQGMYTLAYTAYIDAITHWGITPEQRLPFGTQYHDNIYEIITPFISGGEVRDANYNLDVSLTTWGFGLMHTTIDDDATVQGIIIANLTSHVVR